MTTIACHTCGYRFETAAKSNRTRCGACRAVVKVPLDVRRANGYVSGRRKAPDSAPLVLVLQLSCGHVSAYFDEGIRASEAGDYLWSCDECGAEDQDVQRALGALSEDVWADMDEHDFIDWYSSLAAQAVAT